MSKPFGELELYVMKRMWRAAKAYQRYTDFWPSEFDERFKDDDIELLKNLGVPGLENYGNANIN